MNLAKRRSAVVICWVRWSALETFDSGEPQTPRVPAIKSAREAGYLTMYLSVEALLAPSWI